MVRLPEKLRVVRPYLGDVPDYSDSAPLHIKVKNNKVVVSLPEGNFSKLNQNKRMELLTQHRHLFHLSPPNAIYGLFDHADPWELTAFSIYGEADISGYRVKEFSGNLIISKGGTKTEIINISPRLDRKIERNLDAVNKEIQNLLEFKRDFSRPASLITPSSDAVTCALQDELIFNEVKAVSCMPKLILDKFYTACLGGIMESTGIGTRYMAGFDMQFCHGNLLKKYPGTADSLLVPNVPYKPYHLQTSVYKVAWDIPKDIDSKLKIRPIPKREEYGLSKPTGKWTDWYYKGWIDLAEILNEEFDAGIKYKVVESYAYINRKPIYPFAEYMHELELVKRIASKLYPNLSVKFYYATLPGSSKSIRTVINANLSTSQKTSRFFAPTIYGYTLTEQNKINYLRFVRNQGIALKIDATEEENIHEEDGLYVFKGAGKGTFLNQYLKSTKSNNNVLWKDVIEASRDLPHVLINQDFYPSIKELTNPFKPNDYKLKLGRRYTKQKKLKPSYGTNRVGPKINHVGELLENWLESEYGQNPEPIDYNLMRFDKYKEFFGVNNETIQ